MLKITTGTDVEEVLMKLEGELAGTWVRDLEESWQAMRAASAGRPACLDLTGVTRVDEAGRYLLALIHVAGARMVSRGIAMKDLLDSIGREWPVARIEGPEWAAVPPQRP